MREEQRYPHQHRHTDTDRQEQRVLEKETEAGYKRGGESIETQGSRQRGTDNRFRFAQGEGERRLSTETPSTWQNRRGTGWWRDRQGGRRAEGRRWPPWGFVHPYHMGGLAALVLQFQKSVQFLLALQ